MIADDIILLCAEIHLWQSGCSDIRNVFSKTERVDVGLMVVTAPAGIHKRTSYLLDMSNRFVSLSLLLDKLRLIALINLLHDTLIRLSLTRALFYMALAV